MDSWFYVYFDSMFEEGVSLWGTGPMLIHKYSDSETVRIVVIIDSLLPDVFLYIPHSQPVGEAPEKWCPVSTKKVKHKNNCLLT